MPYLFRHYPILLPFLLMTLVGRETWAARTDFLSICGLFLSSDQTIVKVGNFQVDGQFLRYSPYRYNGDSFPLRFRTFKPKDGVGHLIVATRLESKRSATPVNYLPSLWQAIRTFPEYFAKFDFYADNQTIVMPDIDRLNILNKDGIQFLGVPYFGSQTFSEIAFISAVKRGFVLTAVRGDLLFHDRLEEHLVGTLLMPRIFFDKAVHYTHFEQAWLALKSAHNLIDNDMFRSFQGLIIGHRGIGYLWDRATGRLGKFIAEHERAAYPEEESIFGLTKLLLEIDAILQPGMEDSSLNERLRYRSPKQFDQMTSDLEPLIQRYKVQPVTREWAREQAVALLKRLYNRQ
ncbi:MAG: hypothetical protein IPJ71_17230 [Bdellovibrionales bacterium]|nr:hypothetical protein [Bdellovibrionales bacterium]